MTGLIGSSVNFTWSFYGDVGTVNWGLPNAAVNSIKTILVSITKAGKVAANNGRVSGSRTGDSSSGQVIFTLSNIRQDDERLYLCQIKPPTPGSNKVDTVKFVAQSECVSLLTNDLSSLLYNTCIIL